MNNWYVLNTITTFSNIQKNDEIFIGQVILLSVNLV